MTWEGEKFPVKIKAPDNPKSKSKSSVYWHLREFLRGKDWPQLYRRKIDASHPADGINTAYTLTGNDNYSDNPNELVADHGDLWIQLGKIPMVIASQGKALQDTGVFEQYSGEANGTLPYEYSIRPGDHVIDPNENTEYRVEMVNPSLDKTVKMVQLKWLPTLAAVKGE
jgi:hypothetical protein